MRQEATTIEREPEQASGLLRSSAVLGLLTMVSRVTGFAREVLVAGAFGTSASASALVLAQTVPNLTRSLASEDVAQGALVPTVNDLKSEGRDVLAVRVLWLSALFATLVLIALTVLVGLLAGVLVDAVGPGVSGSQRSQTIDLLVLLAPIIAFNGLLGVGSAACVSDGRFALVGAAAIASNLPVLLGLAVVPGISIEAVALLLVAGYALQAVALSGAAGWRHRRSLIEGLRTRIALRGQTRQVMRGIGVLAPPIILSLGLANLSGVVDAAFASLVSVGAPAALDKAFRLIMLPYGVIALAVGMVALPRLAASTSPDQFDRELVAAFRLQAAILVPLAVALALLAGPLVNAVYVRGEFGDASAALTTDALLGFCVALPALGAGMIGARAWLARKRAWFPAFLAFGGLIANGVLNWALIGPLGIAGIGIATGAVHLSVGTTLVLSAATDRVAVTRSLATLAGRLLFVSLLGAAVGVVTATVLQGVLPDTPRLGAAAVLGSAAGLWLASRLGLHEYRELVAEVRRR